MYYTDQIHVLGVYDRSMFNHDAPNECSALLSWFVYSYIILVICPVSGYALYKLYHAYYHDMHIQ